MTGDMTDPNGEGAESPQDAPEAAEGSSGGPPVDEAAGAASAAVTGDERPARRQRRRPRATTAAAAPQDTTDDTADDTAAYRLWVRPRGAFFDVVETRPGSPKVRVRSMGHATANAAHDALEANAAHLRERGGHKIVVGPPAES